MLENGVFSCVPFCLRSRRRFARCESSYHGVFICAAHAFGRVSLDPEKGEEVVWWSEGPGVLDGVRRHPVPLLPDVDPPVVVVGRETLHNNLTLASALRAST